MKPPFNKSILVNALLFQICWFACVVGSSYALTWPALLSLAGLAAYQLRDGMREATDLKLVGIALVLGIVFDSLWVLSGVMTFKESSPFTNFAPLWILALWMAFALTVNHSMAWMKSNLMLPALLGAVGGPLAYYTGLKLGAVDYHLGVITVSAALALAWSVSLVILVVFSKESSTTPSTANI